MAGLSPASFAALLKRHRLAAGLTQEELAERAHVSTRAVSALERGVNLRPHWQTLWLLADALDLSGAERTRFEAVARGHRGHAEPWTHLPYAGRPSIPLVGRGRELGLIDQHLAGEGLPVLFLAGEPGIGKSRLLREVADYASARQMAVLIGGCQRPSGLQPHSPLLEALERGIQVQPRALLPSLLEDCAWLVRLLPELEEVIAPPATEGKLAPEQERRLVFRAVVSFLANVAGPNGTILLLDDLQWAGPDALDLLAAIAHAAETAPLRIVGAYRHTDVAPEGPLSVTVGTLAGRDLAQGATLGPLAEEEAAELLARLLEGDVEIDADVVRNIVDRAEGVPFFLVSSARAVRAGALAEGREGLPWNVAESVRRRVAVLSTGEQEILSVAAVIGRVVPRSVLLAVSEREEEVISGLEALSRAGLLLEKGEQAFRFAHDVIREVVEEDLGAARRMVIHARVAAALEALPEGNRAPELAWHFMAGGEPERALPHAVLAGDQALAASAYAGAAEHYGMAADIAREADDARREAEAREKLGNVRHLQARYDDALEALERSAQLYHDLGNLESEMRVLARIGWTHSRRGTPEEGIRRLEPALRLLEAGSAERENLRTLVQLSLPLSTLYLDRGRYEEQLLLAERASELARAVGDDRLFAQAEGRRGLALQFAGRYGDAIQVLEGAVPLLEEAGDLEALLLALACLASSYHYGRGNVDEAQKGLEQALKVAERAGNALEIVLRLVGLANIVGCIGDWARQRRYFELALETTERLDAPDLRARPLVDLGCLSLNEGKWEEASRYLEEAAAYAERGQFLEPRGHLQVAGAAAHFLQGRPEPAIVLLEQLLERPPFKEFDVDWIQAFLASAYLEAGHLCRAEETATACIERMTARSDRLKLPEALVTLGRVRIEQGRWEEAERVLGEALALARFVHNRFSEGHALAACGILHLRRGETDMARERLLEGLVLYRELGAEPFVERIEGFFRQL